MNTMLECDECNTKISECVTSWDNSVILCRPCATFLVALESHSVGDYNWQWVGEPSQDELDDLVAANEPPEKPQATTIDMFAD